MKLKLSFCLILINNISFSIAQITDIPSPQAYGFVRYGNTEVTSYAGETNINIPIYEYTDGDFNIPVALEYNSAGFFPNKREGIIGLNWHLNAGGVITRKVNGYPDDSQNLSINEIGTYLVCMDEPQINLKSPSELFSLSGVDCGEDHYPGDVYGVRGELKPDDFYFSLPGALSGTFFIQNNAEAVCSGNFPYKVDLSGLSRQGNNLQPNSSTIIILTSEGYKYYFGGDVQYLEVSYGLESPLKIGISAPYIIAWYLNKIEAPNGRTVTFKYRDFNDGIIVSNEHGHTELADDTHYLFNAFKYSEQITNYDPHTGTLSSSNIGEAFSFSATKTVYLEEINIDDKTKINFEYKKKDNKFYTGNLSDYTFNQKGLMVENIKVRYDHSIIKSVTPLYNQELGRLFLSSLIINPHERYIFEYYHPSNYPDPLTKGVDHWGFWNGKDGSSNLIPNGTIDANYDVSIVGTNRDTDVSFCQYGMLKKITYPTKGSTKFYYEGHEYSKRLERRSDNGFMPKLYDEIGKAGGARIKNTEDDDGKGNVIIKEYKYVKDYPEGSSSSGILMDWPTYYVGWGFNCNGLEQNYLAVKSNSFHVNYTPGEKYIHYGEVTEISKNLNKGATKYKFTNYETHPDDTDYNTCTWNQTIYDCLDNVGSYIASKGGFPLNNRAFERGKVYEEISYGNSFNPVKRSVSSYTSRSENSDEYVVSLHLSNALIQTNKKYITPFLKRSETVYIYDQNSTLEVVSTNEYRYNKMNQLSIQQSDNSDDSYLKTYFLYPTDYLSGTTFIDDMMENNIVSYPIEKVKMKTDKYNSTFVLSGDITTYKPGGLGLIDKKYNLEFTDKNGLPYSKFRFSNQLYSGQVPSTETPTVFNPDIKYTEKISFNEYDFYGNPIGIEVKNSAPISYAWGYGGVHLIAKVTNAKNKEFFYTSFEEESGEGVDAFNSKTGVKSWNGNYTIPINQRPVKGNYVITYWEKTGTEWEFKSNKIYNAIPTGVASTGKIDELRIHPINAQMTTYTYDPLIGITSQADPNNNITYFEYDIFHRLILIKDNNKNIIRNFQYNFAK